MSQHQFAIDVQQGLSRERKTLPSKYFYDEKGSQLFNQITRHPDYYLTGCELEILETHKEEISQLFQNQTFNLIELGPGEGIKSFVLLKQFLQESHAFSYCMIDISKSYLNDLKTRILQHLPGLEIHLIDRDFHQGIPFDQLDKNKKNIVLFLGSAIGNYNAHETEVFLNKIRKNLNAGDWLLIGFDLKKNMNTLFNAYDDSEQITRAFNLNLLERMNRELEMNFQIDQFQHFPTYNVHSGAMESYLVSVKDQQVYSRYLDQRFDFHAYEGIHVESSYKYTLEQIRGFADNTGFRIVRNFGDSKGYFVLSLWQV